MPLNKNFLHPKAPQISRFQLVSGLLIGLLYAFVFYSTLYLTREILRIVSVTDNNDLWILTDAEVSFYNLFFAFIAVLLGQSVCFIYWIDRPKRRFGQVRRRVDMINDQRVLIWYFLAWFSKLGFVFLFLYACSFKNYGFFFWNYNELFYNSFWSEIDFYPNYNYVYVLIIIVLFLQSWTTIRRVFKKKSLKWMLVSMVTLSILACGLSRINLIDYKKINARILKGNIHYTYGISLPELISPGKRNGKTYYSSIDIYIASPKELSAKPIIIIGGEELALKELSQKIAKPANQYDYQHYHLHIDRTIKMKFIQKLYRELGKIPVRRFDFATNNPHKIHDRIYYQNNVFPMSLQGYYTDFMTDREALEMLNGGKATMIEIKPEKSGYLVDDSLIQYKDLQYTIYQKVLNNNPSYVIKLYLKDDMNVESYLKIRFAVKEGINQHKNEEAIRMFSKKYNELPSIEQRKEIREKYPFAILEITEEMATNFE